MNKYPYIGKGKESGSIVLFYGESEGVTLESKSWASSDLQHSNCINESVFENITREYLTNTYGKVDSKELADFIVELAEGHGFTLNEDYKTGDFFFLYNGRYGFASKEFCEYGGAKLITIPLPPKDLDIKEFPQVGDEVFCEHLCDKTLIGELLALTKEYAIVQLKDFEQHLHLHEWCLSKPPTLEEDLREKLHEFFINSNADLAKAIINGEIKGLTYEVDK